MARKFDPDLLIFTDLDGTLLDHQTYSWKEAGPALKLARKRGFPVIFCSSKTRAEIEPLRKATRNTHPFIVENGEAICIPAGYFDEKPAMARKRGGYWVISLGKPYKELREAMKAMQKEGLKVKGFGDMSVKDVMELTGLTKEKARLAMKREYDEPFIIEDTKQEPRVREFILKKGMEFTKGGRFCHLMGSTAGKGVAVKLLTGMYGFEAGKPPVTMGLGDSQNDFSMLMAVHVPYLMHDHRGKHRSLSSAFITVDGSGPEEWGRIVKEFIEEGDYGQEKG